MGNIKSLPKPDKHADFKIYAQKYPHLKAGALAKIYHVSISKAHVWATKLKGEIMQEKISKLETAIINLCRAIDGLNNTRDDHPNPVLKLMAYSKAFEAVRDAKALLSPDGEKIADLPDCVNPPDRDDLPDCSEPHDKFPNRINAMLRDIKAYRKQILDPEGYRADMAAVIENAKTKKISGSAQGGRKEGDNK